MCFIAPASHQAIYYFLFDLEHEHSVRVFGYLEVFAVLVAFVVWYSSLEHFAHFETAILPIEPTKPHKFTDQEMLLAI